MSNSVYHHPFKLQRHSPPTDDNGRHSNFKHHSISSSSAHWVDSSAQSAVFCSKLTCRLCNLTVQRIRDSFIAIRAYNNNNNNKVDVMHVRLIELHWVNNILLSGREILTKGRISIMSAMDLYDLDRQESVPKRYLDWFSRFYPRAASSARVIAIIVCLCVCLSVCLSVTHRYRIKTAKRRITQTPRNSPGNQVF